jgi:hypothetical protein
VQKKSLIGPSSILALDGWSAALLGQVLHLLFIATPSLALPRARFSTLRMCRVVLSIVRREPIKLRRFKQIVHPACTVWMHHLEVHSLDDLDDEVDGSLHDAYHGAMSKATLKSPMIPLTPAALAPTGRRHVVAAGAAR